MSGSLTIVLAAVSCGAAVAITEPVAIALLRRGAVIDMPGPRSSHTTPTPRGGGAPIAVGLLVAAAVIHNALAVVFAVAVAGFAAIGFTEDLRGLSIPRRLALQSLVAITIAGLILSPLRMPAVPLAVLAVIAAVGLTGFVNAFNFMDGVNGISAVHALIGGAAYALLGVWRPDTFLIAAGAALATGALAFLPWNAFRARVFLGDVGSYVLGAALAVLAMIAASRGVPDEAALAPLALYLADTSWTLLRRILAGQSWCNHHAHVYQHWAGAGWSHQRVTVVTSATTLLLCLLGAASLTGGPALRALADAAAVSVLALYLRSPALLGHTITQPEISLGCAS